METLFPDSETFQKNRPTALSEAQEKAFYLKMAHDLIKEGHSTSGPEDIAGDLEALSLGIDNGYEMAKDLDSSFRTNADYEFTTEFCEWLDWLSSQYRAEIDNNIKAWVKAHDIQPKMEKGSTILINERVNRIFKPGDTAYIYDISREGATYIVNSDPTKKGGYLINYEDLEGKCTVQNQQ